MSDQDRTFSELLGDLMYGDMPSNLPEEDDDEESLSEAVETDAEDTREAPDSADPDKESQAEADKLEADPVEDDDAEPPVEEDEPDTGAVEGEAEDVEGDAESDDPEPDIDGEDADDDDDTEADIALPEGYVLRDGQLFAETVVDGERQEVPADELRKGYMRQADYSRKTQQVSEQQKQVNQALEDQRSLIREINSHSGMQEFLSEHPEAYEFLLANPEDTRTLMQNDRELDAFAQDYEILSKSPRLADAYLRSGEGEAARSQLQQHRARTQYQQFAVQLDNAIDQIASHEQYAEHLSDDDVMEVKKWVMDLGGLEPNMSPDEAMVGLQRLATMFTTPDGQQYDMKLVLDRFDAIKERANREADREARKAEEHNKKVDEELEEQKKRTPSTPRDEGGGAAAEPETAPQRESLTEVLGALTS